MFKLKSQAQLKLAQFMSESTIFCIRAVVELETLTSQLHKKALLEHRLQNILIYSDRRRQAK